MRIFHHIAALGGAALIASPLLAAPPSRYLVGPDPRSVQALDAPPLLGPGAIVHNVDGRPGNQAFGDVIKTDQVTIVQLRDQERTWLGVQLGPVPAALASHLGLDKNGLIVRNVYVDSPAERAGLRRHDVLVEADGQPISGRLEEFSRHIRSKNPGDTLSLKLYRGGKELTVDIELETEPRGMHWFKYDEDDPDVLLWRDFDLRGKIMQWGPNGWEVFDLGELPDFKHMLREMEGFLPRSREVTARRVDKDGRVLQVRRMRDGRIEVRRESRGAATQPEGSGPHVAATIMIYQNEDALRQQDPEAAELLEQQERADQPEGPRWRVHVPGADRGERLREFRERFFRGARPDREGPRGEGRPGEPPREDRPGRGGRPDVPPPPPAGPRPPTTRPAGPDAPPRPEVLRVPGGRSAQPRISGEPSVRFDVQPNGEITVTSREGDDELSITYSSREAFREAAPELFKRFEAAEKRIR